MTYDKLNGYLHAALQAGFRPLDDLTRESFAGAGPDALICDLELPDEEVVLVIYDGTFSIVVGTQEFTQTINGWQGCG